MPRLFIRAGFWSVLQAQERSKKTQFIAVHGHGHKKQHIVFLKSLNRGFVDPHQTREEEPLSRIISPKTTLNPTPNSLDVAHE